MKPQQGHLQDQPSPPPEISLDEATTNHHSLLVESRNAMGDLSEDGLLDVRKKLEKYIDDVSSQMKLIIGLA